MCGWIKIHRKIIDWEWYHDQNTRAVFFHLLLTVNYEEKKWRGRTILCGQRLCGRKQLAKELNLSEQNIRTAIKHLQLTNEVTIETFDKASVITVNNYQKFQSITDQLTIQSTSKSTSKSTSNLTNEKSPEDIEMQVNNHQKFPHLTNKLTSKSTGKSTTTKEYKKIRSIYSEVVVAKASTTSGANQKNQKITFSFDSQKWENIGDEIYNAWIVAYPACDIEHELSKMAAWLVSNPKRKKNNYARFINTWLSKTQDKGGTHANHSNKHDVGDQSYRAWAKAAGFDS